MRACCFHFGRCGSTVLGNMLNSVPNMQWAGEIFHELHESELNATPMDAIAHLRSNIPQNNKVAFGFETKFQHLDANGLNVRFVDYVDQLTELGFLKFVFLKRRNYLRQAISVARGQQTKTWHVSADAEKPNFDPVVLDLENISLGGCNRPILKCFEFLDHTYQESEHVMRSLGLDTLTLNYEDDLEPNPDHGFRRICDYMGLPYNPTPCSVQKLESRPIPEIVSDFDKINSCLSGTPYQWMLHQ